MKGAWEKIKSGQRFMQPDVLKGVCAQGQCVLKDYRRYRGTPWSFLAAWLVRREARCLKRLSDTGVAPQPYDAPDTLVLAMSWHEGHRPAPGDGASLEGLFEALRIAHGRGFIHNDVHASNVLVGPAGVVVLDWASALRVPPAFCGTFLSRALMRRDVAHAFKLRARTLGRPLNQEEQEVVKAPLWMRAPRSMWLAVYRRWVPKL